MDLFGKLMIVLCLEIVDDAVYRLDCFWFIAQLILMLGSFCIILTDTASVQVKGGFHRI